ncbi:MAG: glycosyl hydrolase family 18 protein [Treponema sp.]|nr:glycosyl hydrolase family 18 protein [Treponema sp.]
MNNKKLTASIMLAGMLCAAVFAAPKKYPKVTEKTLTDEGWMYPEYTHPYKENDKITGEPVIFDEVWGYVMTNKLKDYDENAPLTDIGLFAAEIDSNGLLCNVPQRKMVKNFKGKVHLVAVCESRSLSHFVLEPKYDCRQKVIDGLLKASEEFDGLQIDYELVNKADKENFHSFLKELKKGLGKKELTVCVPARIKTLKNDTYDYKTLSEIVDRIMIMAYDEHWSTSKAGSIASLDWCEQIADYAKTIMPEDKYIMGLPFYGRTWADRSVHRAWIFNGVNRQIHEYDVQKIERERGVPHFKASVTVNIECWYEDAYSIVERARMYQNKGYGIIAFWCMGQEDAAVWEWIGNKKSGTKKLQ